MATNRVTKPETVNYGCVDFITYSNALSGWLTCGWIAHLWDSAAREPRCTLDFGDRTTKANGLLILFPREDVIKVGVGFLLFVPDAAAITQLELTEIRLRSESQRFTLPPAHTLHWASENEAITRARAQLNAAPRSLQRTKLLALISKPAFTGEDTLQFLNLPVFLETDAAIFCPPDGLLLRGWYADPFGQVARLRLRSGARRFEIDPAHWVSIARPDVRDAMSQTHSAVTENCGFLLHASEIFTPGQVCYYEIETHSGKICFKTLPALRSPGLAVIKETLSVFDLRYGDMVQAYDHVVGPAVLAMNRFRLQEKPRTRVLPFGPPCEAPVCTLIIPLYGRIDFMEYQLASFARTLRTDVEIIYVLDDPRQTRAAEILAASCLARFGLSFVLINLSVNRGYAPANNIGLAHARAPYVCFLNSDVFPAQTAWLEPMLETAQMDAVGAVGALLLYEDGTIQHEGCSLEELPEFGNWKFALHSNKGRLPSGDTSLLKADAVTGACLVMRTELVRALGGMDEDYVIGDFEDIDLCIKITEMGLSCLVDRRARLYHLERQSQGGQQTNWRLNLTLFNAWHFQQRIGAAQEGGRALAGPNASVAA